MNAATPPTSTSSPKRLGVNVFTAPAKAFVGERPKPFGEPLGWDPITSTLIYGDYDAVLVDTLTPVAEAQALADWVELRHRNLTTIYVTHVHFGHFYGLSVLLRRFPGARAIATPKSVEVMHQQLQTGVLDQFIRRWWPGQLAAQMVTAQPYDHDTFTLEGPELRIIEQGPPTACTRRRCTFPRSTSSSAATCSTTHATCSSGISHRRVGVIGSRHWTGWPL